MKQCKVCGTLVHIDSNTCPSCGNRNFFVLDVKICPLCGKVNGIANSFCEQCGKPFVTAQGGAYIKRPAPVRRPAMANYPKVFNQHQQPQAQHDLPVKSQPTVAESSVANVQELSAKHAYKDFVALKPDVVEGDDYSEVSYYVKGEGDKLPVIILPKFAKTSGKNIIVNIVVEPKKQENAPAPEALQASPAPAAPAPVVTPASAPITAGGNAQAAAPVSAPATENVQSEGNIAAPAAAIPDSLFEASAEEFKPFSAIQQGDSPAITPKAQPFDDSVSDASAKKGMAAVKGGKQRKGKKGRIVAGIIALALAIGAVVGFILPYYTVKSANITVSGLSVILHQLAEWGAKVEISFLDLSAHQGYDAYVVAAATNGQFAQFAGYVPYAFIAIAASMLIMVLLSFISIFSNRKCIKVMLVLFSGFAGLVTAAIALAMKFIFNTGFFNTLSLGLIITASALLVFFLFVLIFVRSRKKDRLSSI